MEVLFGHHLVRSNLILTQHQKWATANPHHQLTLRALMKTPTGVPTLAHPKQPACQVVANQLQVVANQLQEEVTHTKCC